MPNPFMRLGKAQSREPVDRSIPVPVEPVPETVAGPVFAYRGMETHGVEPGGPYRDPIDYDSRGVVVYEDEEEQPDPIPVYVVNQGAREIRDWRTIRTYAATQGQSAKLVINDDYQSRRRSKVTVKNMDVSPVYIGHDQTSASPAFGFILGAGEKIDLNAQSQIWAVGTAAYDAPLAVIVEYVRVIDGND